MRASESGLQETRHLYFIFKLEYTHVCACMCVPRACMHACVGQSSTLVFSILRFESGMTVGVSLANSAWCSPIQLHCLLGSGGPHISPSSASG